MDFFSESDQICRKLWIWSHLLKKSLVENFILFCNVYSEHWRNKRKLKQQRNLKKSKMMKEVMSITTKKSEGIHQLLKIFKFWEVTW